MAGVRQWAMQRVMGGLHRDGAAGGAMETVLLVTSLVRVLQVLEWAEVSSAKWMVPLVIKRAMATLVLSIVRVSHLMYHWCCRWGGCCR